MTAVGGTEFNENGGSYWGATNGANGGSAFAYIPEMGWNDSSDGTGLDTALASTGGGKSIFFPTPTWQSGSGFPNNGKRDVPDISMAASADHDGYLVCIHPDCPNYYDIFGGTSASTPLMAGVLALVNQYLVASGTQSHAGLGNINPALYSIYQTNHNVFHDVTAGSNIVPCQIGTTNCSTGSMGYSAGHGYDLVTGLGSVDAYNLVTAWAQPQGTTLSVASSHTGSFTQGQTGATYTVTVSNKGTGSTSGTVTLAETIPSGLTLVSMTGSGWTCNSNTCTNSGVLAGGASYSAVTVTVNVALTAPGQVTNSVKVSGGNSASATATDPTTILPLLASDVMSKTTPSGSGCTPPASTGGFQPTDSQALIWFLANYANVGDQVTANWYEPGGSLYTTASWSPVSAAGGRCFWDSINIAGATPATMLGGWSVTILWNGSTLFTQHFTIGTFLAADFNHDGHPDVIWEDPKSGFAQVWYLGGSQGVTVTGAANLTQTNPWHIVGVADFNNDGNPDVVWQDPVSGAVQVWYLGGSGRNALQSALNITAKNSWQVVSIADFNQDGHPDLLWEDPKSGFSQIWYLGGPQGITLLGAANGGAMTINNAGTMIGRIDLSDAGNTEAPNIFNNSSNNSWHVTGTNELGSGLADTFNNTGTVYTTNPNAPADNDVTVLAGVEHFNNGGPTGTGTINMQDGYTGDVVHLTPTSGGTVTFDGAPGKSLLAVDSSVDIPQNARSDMLVIDGSVTGSTAVYVNNLNPGFAGSNPVGIPIVFFFF